MWFTVVVGVTAALGTAGAMAQRVAGRSGCSALWLGVGRARADPARRRQRAPVPHLHPGAGRAGRARARPRSRGCCRTRPRAVPRRQRAAGRCRSSLFALYVVAARSCGWRTSTRSGRTSGSAAALAALATGADLRHLAAAAAAARRARRGRPRAGAAGRRRWCRPGSSRSSAQWAATRTYKNYHASVELGRHAAARHAGARQARQRPLAREPDPADLRRPRLRQLRGPEDSATMCDIF